MRCDEPPSKLAHPPSPSGIHHYASGPPRSLTASLGREIEKFDQLCDALESRLVRIFLSFIGRRYLRSNSCGQSQCYSAISDANRNDSKPPSPPSPRPSQLPHWLEHSLCPHPHFSRLGTSRINPPWPFVDSPPSLSHRFRGLHSLPNLIYLRCA